MKHKFYTAFCLLLLLLAAGCAKKADLDLPNTVADQFRNEDQTIQLYLAANNISAQRDISGLYFKIVSYGNGTRYIGPRKYPLRHIYQPTPQWKNRSRIIWPYQLRWQSPQRSPQRMADRTTQNLPGRKNPPHHTITARLRYPTNR